MEEFRCNPTLTYISAPSNMKSLGVSADIERRDEGCVSPKHSHSSGVLQSSSCLQIKNKSAIKEGFGPGRGAGPFSAMAVIHVMLKHLQLWYLTLCFTCAEKYSEMAPTLMWDRGSEQRPAFPLVGAIISEDLQGRCAGAIIFLEVSTGCDALRVKRQTIFWMTGKAREISRLHPRTTLCCFDS